MSNDLLLYNKIFENKIRLQIMSVLVSNDACDFNSLKDLLDVTDGNLASNIKVLEKEEYISVTKSFVGKKPHTLYARTEKGIEAFKNHLKALEYFIKQSK
ncbi:winged helix-turn-helix domain-containing protein [Gynurincola endophyticus]|uniref:winged helix-turn-helix domain-containing protein n=1 Tax=Gynurincola endophyticus TaxID=2479004 RepID=UPI000F8F2A22|nr:transcriptional regulator [Gynurincola endophyticus]